ncbi:MAG: DUF3006 domain-containing protein [Oscillospiraceae bacterium]|jgi:hypothetical protein|nr:DUF3006 domain-containing protein [Oscillospiraceae bacterium]
MRVLILERFEGTMAICEDENKKFFAIDIGELPTGARVGDVLVISAEGEIAIDPKRTEIAKKKIRGMEDKLWR